MVCVYPKICKIFHSRQEHENFPKQVMRPRLIFTAYLFHNLHCPLIFPQKEFKLARYQYAGPIAIWTEVRAGLTAIYTKWLTCPELPMLTI